MKSRGAVALVFVIASAAGADPTSVTVPLEVEGSRVFVTVDFHRADGSVRPARFQIDTGGGGFLLMEPLARDLGLRWGEPSEEEGQRFSKADHAPETSIGGKRLAVDPDRVLVVLGKDNFLPPVSPGHAEGMLPGHILAKYHVVLDYLAQKFTLADPGALKPIGTRMPMPVSKATGFPWTEIEVDGKRYPMLLDCGASTSIISERVAKEWGEAHAWPRFAGAHGESMIFGGPILETIYLPSIKWGNDRVLDVAVVSQREEFEKWMSSMMTAPIVGSLGGNVLKNFRVDLDYPNQALYLSHPRR